MIINGNILKSLINNINGMDEQEHLYIFKLIKNKEYKYTENDNGIFIRLNQLSMETIKEIKEYVDVKMGNDKEIIESSELCENQDVVVEKNDEDFFLENPIKIDEWKKKIILELQNKTKVVKSK